jgi:hypothetical protein
MKVNMDWRTGFLVAIWFLVGAIIFAITKDWQIVAAIATWLLAGGLIFAILQIRQARRSTNAQLAMELFRELRNDRVLEILRHIYNISPKQDSNYLTPIHRQDIDYVLNRLTTLGILVNEGVVDKTLAIEGFSGPAVVRCWHQLFNYIKQYQENMGDYIENYEGFVNCCLKYFTKADIRVEFKNDYAQIQDLVTELAQDKERCPRSLKEIKRDRKKRAKVAEKARSTNRKAKSTTETSSSGEV